MKKDIASVVSFFEESGRVRYDAALSGDYKAGNRELPQLVRMVKLFKKNRVFAAACISQMLKSDNVVVRTDAAACCLALGDADMGEKILEEISKDPENGIFGFNAEMTLKVWRETGELYVYQKIKEF